MEEQDNELEMTFTNVCATCDRHAECDSRDSWIVEEQFQKCSDAGCPVWEDDEYFIYSAQGEAIDSIEYLKGDR